MKPKDTKVIKAISSLLVLFIRPLINAVNAKLKQPEQFELKGIKDTKVVLKLMVPMNQLEPEAQETIKKMRVIRITDSPSAKS